MYTVEAIPANQDYRLSGTGDPATRYSNAASEANQPRAVAVINGVAVQVEEFELECNTHGASDSGSLTIGIAGNPDWSISLQAALADGAVICEVYAGFPPNPNVGTSIDGLVRVFFGLIQTMSPEFDTDTMTFRLQSLAALLTAQKITTQFGQSTGNGGLPGTAGFTTVQFVGYVAGLFNLQTNIDVPGTPALMTQVYAARQWVGIKNVRAMDMLIACAETDNADVFVDAQGVLNYVQPSAIGRRVRPMQWGRDLAKAGGEHAPQYSKTIRVQVNSWTKKTRTSTSSMLSVNPAGTLTVRNSTRIVGTERIAGSTAAVTTVQTFNADGSYTSTSGIGVSTGGAANSGETSFSGESGIETYRYSIKNLTPQQCNAKAIQLWNQISRFEYTLSIAFAVTPELIGPPGQAARDKNGSVLDITTLYQITNLPLSAFNNSTEPGILVQSKIEPGSEAALEQGYFKTVDDTRFYYQRRFVLRYGVGREDGSQSEGFHITVDLVNHPLPNSGANSAGGAF